MKIGRVVCGLCILLISLLAIYQPTAVLAQEESLTITTTDLANGMVGEAYSVTLEATGGATPYTWSVSADSLSAGLSLNPATGEISGTPTGEGTVNFTVQVTDSTTPAQEATERLNIRINPIPSVEIKATYPTLEAISGANFEFEVELNYRGEIGGETGRFRLVVTTPEGWSAYMTPQYEREKRISEITLDPGFAAGTKLKLITAPPIWPLSEPGEYEITLEAISGEITGTTELTAKITAYYTMSVVSTTERLNTTAKAGKDNFFSIEVVNLGTAAIDNIKFSSIKPSGWNIKFTPDKIDSLPAFDSQTVDVNIKPPAETIAGDYQITARVSGNQTSDEIEIRVTVETPTIWGWVGVGIIVLVIAGLTYIFMRFSRR